MVLAMMVLNAVMVTHSDDHAGDVDVCGFDVGGGEHDGGGDGTASIAGVGGDLLHQ